MSEQKVDRAHRWRNLAGEVGIIVAGVLIALAAQQAVESWNWRQKVAAAEKSMGEEITNSLLASAELRHLDKCSTAQIDGLQAAMVKGDWAAASPISKSDTMYGFGRLWADDAFAATISAQVVDHLGAEKLKRYAQVYAMIRRARRAQEKQEEAGADLGTLRIAGLPRSSDQMAAEFRALSTLRDNHIGSVGLAELIEQFAAKDLGLAVSHDEYLAARGRREIIRECEASAAALKS